jgi:hypothetical protein
MAVVELTRGLVALVDDVDLPLVAGRSWHASRRSDGKGWYARSSTHRDGKNVHVLMHVLLMGVRGVDHVNRDGLDNRRVNLRQASQSENLANSGKHRSMTSRFKGVFFDRPAGRWRAQIKKSGRPIFLGRFESEECAAVAYNAAAFELFGSYARVNAVED